MKVELLIAAIRIKKLNISRKESKKSLFLFFKYFLLFNGFS